MANKKHTNAGLQDELDIELEKEVSEIENLETGFGNLDLSHDEFDDVAGSLGHDTSRDYQSDDFGFDEENYFD